MSWSFNAIGAPAAIAAAAREQLTGYKCQEPEETIKGLVLQQIEASCAAMSPSTAVKIEAYGSQSLAGDGTATNSLTVKIEPQYNFLFAEPESKPDALELAAKASAQGKGSY